MSDAILKQTLVVDPITINLTEMHGRAIALEQQVSEVAVTDEVEEEIAIDTLGDVKSLLKAVENERKDQTKPFTELVNRIRAMFKPAEESLKRAETTLKDKILAFQQERDQRLAEENRRQMEEYKENAPEGDDPPPVIMQSETTQRGTSGSKVTRRKVWAFEVVGIDKVPGMYLMLDEKAVRAAIKSGQRSIPGLRIYQEETLSASA